MIGEIEKRSMFFLSTTNFQKVS